VPLRARGAAQGQPSDPFAVASMISQVSCLSWARPRLPVAVRFSPRMRSCLEAMIQIDYRYERVGGELLRALALELGGRGGAGRGRC
jgi:hypothetical protein